MTHRSHRIVLGRFSLLQQNPLRGILVRLQWIPLTAMNQVKHNRALLVNKLLLLSSRLKKNNTASKLRTEWLKEWELMGGGGEVLWFVSQEQCWQRRWYYRNTTPKSNIKSDHLTDIIQIKTKDDPSEIWGVGRGCTLPRQKKLNFDGVDNSRKAGTLLCVSKCHHCTQKTRYANKTTMKTEQK